MFEYCHQCMKRLLVNFKSRLLLKIVYKCVTFYNYLHFLQTHLQECYYNTSVQTKSY